MYNLISSRGPDSSFGLSEVLTAEDAVFLTKKVFSTPPPVGYDPPLWVSIQDQCGGYVHFEPDDEITTDSIAELREKAEKDCPIDDWQFLFDYHDTANSMEFPWLATVFHIEKLGNVYNIYAYEAEKSRETDWKYEATEPKELTASIQRIDNKWSVFGTNDNSIGQFDLFTEALFIAGVQATTTRWDLSPIFLDRAMTNLSTEWNGFILRSWQFYIGMLYEIKNHVIVYTENEDGTGKIRIVHHDGRILSDE